jgi:23S rRNA (adenine2503-C2)-methyltransferase
VESSGIEPIWGLTAGEYGAAASCSPQYARLRYAQHFRSAAFADGPVPLRVRESGGLVKFTLALPGGLQVESVIVPMESYRCGNWRTLCASTQAGCRMGCVFCETGRMGLLRNLSAGEIVAQLLAARRLLAEREGAPTGAYRFDACGIRNIVLMGMGEPLDNFDAVVQAIRVLSDPAGVAFPRAKITLSTVGHIGGLQRLAALAHREPEWRKLRLAISLHAADDALRQQLVPIGRAMPLAELKRVLRAFPLPPRGRFLFQYVLLAGVNDSLGHARALAEWCKDLPCVVNLIPYNPQREPSFERPAETTVLAFLRELRARGIFAKRRITHGDTVEAACGQLATDGYTAAPGQSLL